MRPTVLVAGDTAEVVGFGNNWFANKMLTEDEQGMISLFYVPLDMDGNPRGFYTSSTNGSQVMFDDIPPVIDHLYEEVLQRIKKIYFHQIHCTWVCLSVIMLLE